MSTHINPTRLVNESSSANAVGTPAPALQSTAAAQTTVPTGITSVSGPSSTVAASGAVAQNVLPINERQAAAFGQQLSPGLAAQGQAFAQQIVANPSSPELQGRWADYVTEVKAGVNGMDVNGLVQWVLREAYMQNTEDLQFYAEKVKFYNELKSQIRDELTEARKALSNTSVDANAWAKANDAEPSDYPMGYTTKEFDTTNVEFDADGNPAVKTYAGSIEPETREGLENYIKSLEEKLSSVGDDAQLANVDLQNTLQKQQQTLQMMSNISKMLNDTAMAIIRKIG